LPKIPYGMKELYCAANKLTSLPPLPITLKAFYCNKNQLTELDEQPYINKCMYLFKENPSVDQYVSEYFGGHYCAYFDFRAECKRKFANKIGDWYLECNYNPQYKQCRKKLKQSYDELFAT